MPRFFAFLLALFVPAGCAWAQWVEGELPPAVAEGVAEILNKGQQVEQMEQALSVLHSNGYLLASLVETDSGIVVFPGEQYRWAQLRSGNLSERMISRTNFRPGRYSTSAVSTGQISDLFNRVLRTSEREGYPFASVRLDSIQIVETAISASVLYTAGPRVTYDSLIIDGDSRVKMAWLQAYLQVPAGEAYDQENINRIESRISQLPFLELTEPIAVQFVGTRATIILPVDQVPASRFDGVIGFLPNEDEGLRITGQAEIALRNLFNSGKSFDLFWQRMRPETQLLNIDYYHPNLLRSAVDVGLGFHLLKEDTTFLNRDFNILLNYQAGDHSIFFQSRFKSARLLETSQYKDVTELPEVADFNLNDYGVGYEFSRIQPGWLDNSGWNIRVLAALGNKRIERNAGLPPELYEGIDLNSLQSRAEASIHWGVRIGKRSLVVQRWNAGWLDGEAIFLNDQYRIGGFNSLRGFNENQFFAERYVGLNLEYQVYFAPSSNIFAFLDQAFLTSFEQSDNPTGVGIGTTLQTNGGRLQLVYGVGRTREEGFDFRKSKFHFGYIATF